MARASWPAARLRRKGSETWSRRASTPARLSGSSLTRSKATDGLHYRYIPLRVPQPVWSLGGRFVRPRPLIYVAVIGPTGTRVERAHIDPGSDDTVFPDTL